MLKKKPSCESIESTVAPKRSRVRSVTFKREVRRRDISPLPAKPEGHRRMPSDSDLPEPNSFVEITDNSVMSTTAAKLAPIFTPVRAQKRAAPTELDGGRSSQRRRTIVSATGSSSASAPTVLPPTQLPERRTPKVVKNVIEVLSDDEIEFVEHTTASSASQSSSTSRATCSKHSEISRKFDSAPFSNLIHCNPPVLELAERPSSSWIQFEENLNEIEIDFKKYHSTSLKRYLHCEPASSGEKIPVLADECHPSHFSKDKICFKAGRKRREQLGSAASTTPWIDAFAPQKRKEFIHSYSNHLDSFQTWLKDWSHLMDELAKMDDEPIKQKKRQKSKRSEDSDDEDYSEERPLKDDFINTYVLIGPTGCGKTTAAHVYGKAAGFNVVEVSVSDLRSGFALKKKLSETIKSFAVKRAGGIASFFSPNPKKADTPEIKATSSVRKNMVLIDDADIVLSPDKYYWPQLLESCVESRIPIVITITNKLVFWNNFLKSDVIMHPFEHSVPDFVSSHLQYWLSGFSGRSLSKDMVKRVVAENPDDIRRAVSKLEYLSEFKSVPIESKETKSIESLMSSAMLAEFDAILGQLDASSQRSTQCKWPAGCRNSETFEPMLNPDKTQVYTYPEPDDSITQLLRSTIKSHRPSNYSILDESDAILMRVNANSDDPPSSIHPAVIDCFYRTQPRSFNKRAIALDELPALALMDQAFKQRIASGPSSRRILHVFNDVNRHTGVAIDSRGKLCQSIKNYAFPETDLSQIT